MTHKTVLVRAEGSFAKAGNTAQKEKPAGYRFDNVVRLLNLVTKINLENAQRFLLQCRDRYAA